MRRRSATAGRARPRGRRQGTRSRRGRGAGRRRSSRGPRSSCPCARAAPAAGRASRSASATARPRRTTAGRPRGGTSRARRSDGGAGRPSGPAGSSWTSARSPARPALLVPIPAGDTSRSPRTSSGRLCASRSATSPPNEWPATTAGPAAPRPRARPPQRPRSRRWRRLSAAVPDPAVTGQVEREHAVALHQVRQQLDPVSRRAGQPVEQEQRLAAPADVVPNRPRASCASKVRCSRHPRTVSSDDHGNFGGAGPLIPANDNERAMSEPA